MGPQERALKAGVDIVVATPGRLMDHMRHDSVDLLRVQVLVLDEADRMMDMGFWPDVQRILTALPPDRQTLLFSATLPGEILRMATEMLREPRFVQVGQRGAARTIRHEMHAVEAAEKIDWLARFIRRDATGPVLVFVRMKVGADRVARNLQARGIKAAALHADRSQQERLAAVEGFRSGRHPVLVATDIAARGLDIEASPVVNYRCRHARHLRARVGGPAAPAGRHAITLVSPAEERTWRAVGRPRGSMSPDMTATEKFRAAAGARRPTTGCPSTAASDVLPMAGTTGFSPEAWCGDCAYYKAKRVTRKREEPAPQDYGW